MYMSELHKGLHFKLKKNKVALQWAKLLIKFFTLRNCVRKQSERWGSKGLGGFKGQGLGKEGYICIGKNGMQEGIVASSVLHGWKAQALNVTVQSSDVVEVNV